MLRRLTLVGWSLNSSAKPLDLLPFCSRMRCQTAAPAPTLYPADTA
ncbi:MAG: hypothetical protein IJR22_01565 [Acidaminococcaceae bacterium]|nr:hypothetical protein [Acidaminococcaceae bacterium]